MRYWEVDDPAWSVAEHAFARAWRAQPVWVASQSLSSVGPGAELIAGDLGSFVRDLKDRVEGEIDVSGPTLAHSLGHRHLCRVRPVRPFLLSVPGAPRARSQDSWW